MESASSDVAGKQKKRQKKEKSSAKDLDDLAFLNEEVRNSSTVAREDATERSVAPQSKLWEHTQWILYWVVTLAVFFGIVWIKVEQEHYNLGRDLGKSTGGVDYYEILGIARNAPEKELKKAYKKLAIRWHPDKNPDCEECVEKFRIIAEAHATLGDAEKRQLYDDTAAVDMERLPTAHSVELTTDNYDKLVRRSKLPWVIQIYSEYDKQCAAFHPFWEELARMDVNLYVKFGRVNAVHNKGALKLLPISPAALPTVFLYSPRTNDLDVFAANQRIDPQFIRKKIFSAYPLTHISVLSEPEEVDAFLNSTTHHPKVLFSSKTKKTPSALPCKIALEFNGIFEFAFAPASAFTASDIGLRPEEEKSPPHVMLFPPQGSMKPKEKVFFTSKKGNDLKIVDTLLSWQSNFAIYGNRLSAGILCDSNSLFRVFCLLAIDRSDDEVADAMKILRKAKKKYDDTQDKESEDATVIQVVRVRTAPYVAFSIGLLSVDRDVHFADMWQQTGSAPFVICDAETSRCNAAGALENLFSEDLHLLPLPSFALLLPDPLESTWSDLWRTLHHASSTKLISALSTFIGVWIGVVFLERRKHGFLAFFMVCVFGPLALAAISEPFWRSLLSLVYELTGISFR